MADMSVGPIRRAPMGSPSEAALPRRELADVRRKHDAGIRDIREDNRRLASRL